MVVTKKVSPRKCSPRLGIVGSEDEDDADNSDIDEDTMLEVFHSSPISLHSKDTMERIDALVAINKKIYEGVFCFHGNNSPCHV